MSLDDDEEDGDESIENEPNLAQQLALARCDLSVLLIKIQMDLFAPNLRRYYFLSNAPIFFSLWLESIYGTKYAQVPRLTRGFFSILIV